MGNRKFWQQAALAVGLEHHRVYEVRDHVYGVARECGSRFTAVMNGNWPFTDSRTRLAAQVWLLLHYASKGTYGKSEHLLDHLRRQCSTLPTRNADHLSEVLSVASEQISRKAATRYGAAPLSQKELYGRAGAGQSVPPPALANACE